MNVLSESEVEAIIESAEAELDALGPRYRQWWNQIRVRPMQWEQTHAPRLGPAWVVALMEGRCLHFNAIKGGWGWGRFAEFGEITEFHTTRDSLERAVEVGLDEFARS